MNLKSPSLSRPVTVVLLGLLFTAEAAYSQSLHRVDVRPDVSSSLPDAPSTLVAEPGEMSSNVAGGPTGDGFAIGQTAFQRTSPARAPLRVSNSRTATAITVLPGVVADKQTSRDKLIGSLEDSISPFTLIGETISAGYSHLTNGSPNYGTNSPAFGKRLGASIARGTSQNIFAEGVLASVLHEDPRYYELGNSRSLFQRVFYAGTRPLITKTDSGRATPNFALLGGYLGAAALTKTYYPSINQGFNQTLQTYGGSIGGAALGYVVTEFLPDALVFAHLRK